ncbi:MAG: OsmC family protein [Pseudomonadota bacterium]
MAELYSAEVRTVGESMARSTTDVHAFKIFMDEPEVLGGLNGAPSPLDFILAAHAGCLNYMTFFIAKEMGVPIEGTEITVGGSLDPAKFAGSDMSVRAGYQSLDVTITVKSDAPAADLERLRAAVEARCPVSDNLSQPTPISIALKAA